MTTVTTLIPEQRDETVDEGLETWPLVEAAQAGDREAFAELYRLYQPVVHNFVRWRLNGASLRDAEDLTSVVFVRAYARIGTVRYLGRDIGAWFITVARNLIADYHKSSYARLTYSMDMTDVDYWDQPEPGRADEPHRHAVRHEVRADIEAALLLLTPEQARVIRLRFLDEMSIDEVGAAMGLTPGAVKALTYRATHALRKSGRLAAHR